MTNQNKEKCIICKEETEHWIIEIIPDKKFKYYCEKCYEKENKKICIS